MPPRLEQPTAYPPSQLMRNSSAARLSSLGTPRPSWYMRPRAEQPGAYLASQLLRNSSTARPSSSTTPLPSTNISPKSRQSSRDPVSQPLRRRSTRAPGDLSPGALERAGTAFWQPQHHAASIVVPRRDASKRGQKRGIFGLPVPNMERIVAGASYISPGADARSNVLDTPPP